MTCPKTLESDKTPLEIAPRGDDSPGGSLTSKPLNAVPALADAAIKSCQSGVVLESAIADEVSAPSDSSGGVQSLPNPWLFDSEALLRELDRIRETALQVPTNGDANATHFGLQLVINAAWNLRENIRYILGLHRERQRAFGQQHKTGTDPQHHTIYVKKGMLITLVNRMLITPNLL